MCLHVTRKALLVYRRVALRTLLLRKRASFTIRVARAVPLLMLIETGAIELSLAMLTDPSKFELRLWGSRPAFSTSARMVAKPMVLRVPTTFHLYIRGLEGAKLRYRVLDRRGFVAGWAGGALLGIVALSQGAGWVGTGSGPSA